MTRDEFIALAKRITYKPNANVQAFFITPELQQLRVSFHVEDTATPDDEKHIHISMSFPIPLDYFTDERQAVYWILQRIDEAEAHETREWFKLDGVAVFDPHKEAPA